VAIFSSSNLAVYGREGQAPTVTNYDWVHMVGDSGEMRTLVKRSPVPGAHPGMPVPNLVTVDKVSRAALAFFITSDSTTP
jgi:hypothetical protein